MKRIVGYFKTSFVFILTIITVFIMVFTICSVLTFDKTERDVFGYYFFIVESDSMAATDFDAGDVVVVKKTDVKSLKEDDIISFISIDEESFGQVITHKIREIATDLNDNPIFLTYGTTTGVTDTSVVIAKNVIGKYEFSIPYAGYFFKYLKTPIGYITCIFVPFLLLILIQVKKCMELFGRYKRQVKLENKSYAEESRILKEEIELLRKQLSEIKNYEKEN